MDKTPIVTSVETAVRTDSGVWPINAVKETDAYTSRKNWLVSIPASPQDRPTAVVDHALHLLTSSSPLSPDFPHMMAKALLLARFYISNDAEFVVPPLFLIPREPMEEITWEKFEELVKNPSAIAGLAILELGQRTQFWFKDGPGDEGSTQQSMVKATLAELITVASQRNGRGSFAFSDAWILNKDVDYSNTVFFYAIDARYADIIQEMGELVYREPPGRQYVFPPDVVVDEESTKLGVEWTSETGEEFMLDTICPQDLVKMRKHLYVNYDPGYVQNVISKEPFITMSRVARSTTSADPLSSQNGLAISWCLTHLNLSVGLTTTAPDYRRRGIGTRVCQSHGQAQRDWFREHAKEFQGKFIPHCYAFLTNLASHNMFTGFGYQETMGRTFVWLAVNPKVENAI